MCSETALAGVDLLRLGIDAPQEDTLVVRERVQRAERDVEARVGVVDGEHVDGHAVVGELPAGAAGVRVIARDGGRTADVREVRERAKGAEAYAELVSELKTKREENTYPW